MTTTEKALGQAGEDFAARWLYRTRGWNVVARNVHAQGGEVDIIAYDWQHGCYVLVEVKTRTNQNFALGVEAVGPQKQRKMQRAAADFFLSKLRLPEIPEFEIHAMVLLPQQKTMPWQSAFVVEYYDDLS